MLTGTMTMPRGTNEVNIVLLLHGWKSNRQGARNSMLATKLAQEGIGSLSFDFRGHGDSEGDIRQISVSTEAEDVAAACAYLVTNPRVNPRGIGIVGASIGASAALLAMAYHPAAFRCGVLISPRLDFSEVRQDMYSFDGPNGRVENRIMLPVGKGIDFYAEAGHIKCPVMIIHGENDESIPLEQSKKLIGLYPKMELMVISGGNHRLDAHVPKVVSYTTDFLVDHLG
ncbi:MAG: alpha/beta fold hydrolase [Candidatus Doudnabacteria bacterium]